MDKLCNCLHSCSNRDLSHISKPCFKLFAYVLVFRGSRTTVRGNVNDAFNFYGFQFHSNLTQLPAHISTDINFSGRNKCSLNCVMWIWLLLIFAPWFKKKTTHRVIIRHTLVISFSFEVIYKGSQVRNKPFTHITAIYTIFLIKVEM